MAAYRADIEIAVRGLRDLAAVQQKLQETSKEIDRINTVWQNAASAPKGINAFNAAVQKSYALLQQAQVGTEAETIAIENYVRAVTVANTVRDRQNKLIQDQIQLQQKIVPTANAGFGVQGPALPPAVRPNTRGREALSNAIVGGAFPLLFGQGAGASAGGALGGAAGGFAGGAFGMGLSLVGTAVGAQFDAAITSAKDFSAALKEGGDAASYLKERLGSLNPRIAEQIRNLQQSGQTAAAAQLAMQELGRQIGTENAAAFKQLGDDINNATNNFQVFTTTVIAGIARVTQDLRKFAQDNPVLFNLAGGAAGILINPVASLAATATSITGGPGQTKAQESTTPEYKRRTQELNSQYQIAQQQLKLSTLSFETDSAAYVIARRKSAELERQAALQKIAYDLAVKSIGPEQAATEQKRIQTLYEIQLNTIQRERLNYIQQRAKQLQQQEEEAQRKAKQAAEEQRQILDRVSNIRIQVINESLKSIQTEIEQRKLEKGNLVGLEYELSMQKEILGVQQMALNVERDKALMDAKSVEEQQLLLTLYDYKHNLLLRENKIRTLLLETQVAQRKEAEKLQVIENTRAIDAIQLGARAEQAGILSNIFGTLGNKDLQQSAQRMQLRIQQELQVSELLSKRRELETKLETQKAMQQKGINTTYEQNQINTELQRLSIQENMLAVTQKLQTEQLRLNQLTERYGGIFNSIGNGLTQAFDLLVEGTNNWGDSLRNIAATVLKDIAKQLLQIFVIEQLVGFLRNAFMPPVQGIGGINLGMMEAYATGARATGGPVGANQPYMVGERGPELFVPRSSGTIVPNNALAGAGNVSVVVNVDASGSSVQGNDQQASQLGRIVGAQVRQAIITEKRPGGLLASPR